MTNYSESPSMVRVDFFRPSGKWYMTEAWDMKGYYNYWPGPIEAVESMLKADERGRRLLPQFIIVVSEPYHENAYPVCLIPS